MARFRFIKYFALFLEYDVIEHYSFYTYTIKRLKGSLREGVRGQYFSRDEQVKQAVKDRLKTQPAEFYIAGRESLIQRRKIGFEKHGDCIEK